MGLIQKSLRNGEKMVSGDDQLHVVHWLEHGECIEEGNTGHLEVYNPGNIKGRPLFKAV